MREVSALSFFASVSSPHHQNAPMPKFLGFFSKRGFFLAAPAEGLAPG